MSPISDVRDLAHFKSEIPTPRLFPGSVTWNSELESFRFLYLGMGTPGELIKGPGKHKI